MDGQKQFYMVSFTRTGETVSGLTEDGRLTKEERERLQDLLKQDILQHVFMNPDLSKAWLVFKVRNKEDIEAILQSLPYCRQLDFEVHPLVRY